MHYLLYIVINVCINFYIYNGNDCNYCNMSLTYSREYDFRFFLAGNARHLSNVNITMKLASTLILDLYCRVAETFWPSCV